MPVHSIPSLHPITRAEAKRLRSLASRKGRVEGGEVLFEGWKSVAEAIASSWPVSMVVVDPRRLPPNGRSLLEECDARAIVVRSGTAADLRQMSDVMEDQGVVAVAKRPRVLLSDLPIDGDLLVLDGVSDPGNVGTLIRTSDWFGIAGIILGPGCASVENPKVLRSTMGSVFRVPVVEVDDLGAACRSLADRGWTIVTAEVEGGRWPRWAPGTRAALVLGSEAHGVSVAVRQSASVRVSVPRSGGAESLNVAAAGAILLSSLSEQRRA